MTEPIHARARAAKKQFSINKPLFVSPDPAGRKITAGFSYIQRISKGATIDVWFPQVLRDELDELVNKGGTLGPEHFPAEWAAVRQFDLLQEAGNYKIYDLDASYMTRTMIDLTRSMRSGGYRITVATIGSYTDAGGEDDLAILDRRLQDRISRLTHMMYLDEESERINAEMAQVLAEERWDYQQILPHVAITLGARDLFRPIPAIGHRTKETTIIPGPPYQVAVEHIHDWCGDCGVVDAMTGEPLIGVRGKPGRGQYAVTAGLYQFAAADCAHDITISYIRKADGAKLSADDRRQRHAKHFFDILSLLPQKHIIHDTAVGLQLPESIAEQEWIYLAAGEEKLYAMNTLFNDVFTPFNNVDYGMINGCEGSMREIKSTAMHMRGYGDHVDARRSTFYPEAVAALRGMQPS